jgi:hypothetical protein
MFYRAPVALRNPATLVTPGISPSGLKFISWPEMDTRIKGEQSMKNPDFTTTISVDQTPAEAFAAINNVRAWWSGEIQGDTGKLGAAFTYRFKDIHRSTQKVTESIPGKKVVWQVSNSQLSFVKNKGEWDGTNIIFEISEKEGKTQVRFTHAGLVPQYECFGSCSNAWTTLVNNNLRQLIATGDPQPAFA